MALSNVNLHFILNFATNYDPAPIYLKFGTKKKTLN